VDSRMQDVGIRPRPSVVAYIFGRLDGFCCYLSLRPPSCTAASTQVRGCLAGDPENEPPPKRPHVYTSIARVPSVARGGSAHEPGNYRHHHRCAGDHHFGDHHSSAHLIAEPGPARRVRSCRPVGRLPELQPHYDGQSARFASFVAREPARSPKRTHPVPRAPAVGEAGHPS
jgi:hypothetical protein